MLRLLGITKEYRSGDLIQLGLNQVSLNFRSSEFVSILGPSGSGKTTLLNVIGGLDRYNAGDLIINGMSTRNYSDREWDTYRNHSVGFIFQSYHLIPHQTVLSNVEVALTIAGVSAKERKERAIRALEKVGLGDQVHKRPNQLSGGQMQRVAIARALVNEPDILLADEPTGALDTKTSLQVMELLREVAKDRLVIMVTHNPELAEKYSSRIVRLVDGSVVGDTNPYDGSEEAKPKARGMADEPQAGRYQKQEVKKKKASMSLGTALSLSFRNLGTKKGRTALTSIAGSIGIIGIALILGLSTGVNSYVEDVQKASMESYPIAIQRQTLEFNNIMEMTGSLEVSTETEELQEDMVYSNGELLEAENLVTSIYHNNDLAAFKKYLDDPDCEIHSYVGENGITYQYNTPFAVYTYDAEEKLINTDGSGFLPEGLDSLSTHTENTPGGETDMTVTTGATELGMGIYECLKFNQEGEISSTITDNYDIVYGNLPSDYDEVVLVLDGEGRMTLQTMYQLGYLPSSEYATVVSDVNNKKNYKAPVYSFDYETLCRQKFYLVATCDQYEKADTGLYQYKELTQENLSEALELKISGIIRPKEGAENAFLTGEVGYTEALREYLIEHANDSQIVKDQLAQQDLDVRTGFKLEEEVYEMNLNSLGYVNRELPDEILIYVDSAEDKEAIAACIDRYNQGKDKDDRISYTDMLDTMFSSLTGVVNIISTVLIAFVAISLVVSALMIGIITYISVLERTREIGILRAMGASKGNVRLVFLAEASLIGLIAGLIGVGASEILLLIANVIIRFAMKGSEIQASLPLYDAVVLVVISVVLTIVGGLIPAGRASKQDPVIALRSE